MATRQKTIQYAFPMKTTDTVDATVTNLTQITVYIPETVAAFRSVIVEVDCQDAITVTGGTIGEWRVGMQLASSGYTTVTETNDLTHSGENTAWRMTVDMTSLFTASWSGTSMTADCQVYFDFTTGTTLVMRNVTAVIYITYDYDDTASTMIKTVMIPLDSPTGALATASLTEIGTNQVPNLDSLLPETSKTYRDMFFIIEGNEEDGTGTTDYTVGVGLDSEAEVTFGVTEKFGGFTRYCRFVWRRTDMTTNAVHAFKMRANAVAAYNNVTITLVVTYEYAASSSAAMISLQIPFDLNSPLGGTASTDASKTSILVWVEEDTTIAIAQSAARMVYVTAGVISGLNVRTNNEGSTTQSYQAYTNAASAVAGSCSLQRRFEASVSLVRGRNILVFEAYRTDTTDLGWNVSGILFINYTCTVPSGGHGVMNRTIYSLIAPTNGVAVATTRVSASVALATIPETNWYSTSVGTQWQMIQSGTVGINGTSINAERGVGGWFNLYADVSLPDAEAGVYLSYAAFRDNFQRWAGDPDTERSDPENARIWRMTTLPGTCMFALIGMMTYHCITFTIAGTVSGYADADGAGLTVELHRVATGELIGSVTTTSGGAYTFTWYDNTENIYAACYENSTHVGESDRTVAA